MAHGGQESEERRKPVHIEEEIEEAESWLISYADMITIIACFFILMTAFANFDPQTFKEKTKGIANHFSGESEEEKKLKLEEVKENINAHPDLKGMAEIKVNDNNLIITMSSTILFPQNGFALSDEAGQSLDTLIDIIKNYNPDFNIIIEGHSDNAPLSPDLPINNHWALAGARAAAIVERFEYFGYSTTNLRVVSYGDSQPIAPNQDDRGKPIPENQKINRRVVIKVIEPFDKKPKKIGLGVLFNQNETKSGK